MPLRLCNANHVADPAIAKSRGMPQGSKIALIAVKAIRLQILDLERLPDVKGSGGVVGD